MFLFILKICHVLINIYIMKMKTIFKWNLLNYQNPYIFRILSGIGFLGTWIFKVWIVCFFPPKQSESHHSDIAKKCVIQFWKKPSALSSCEITNVMG